MPHSDDPHPSQAKEQTQPQAAPEFHFKTTQLHLNEHIYCASEVQASYSNDNTYSHVQHSTLQPIPCSANSVSHSDPNQLSHNLYNTQDHNYSFPTP